MSLRDRLSRLEVSAIGSRADRWRADMERAKQGVAEASRKLAAIIEKKLTERGVDPDHLPPQTPKEHGEAKRELLQALKARIHD